jgi:plasmid stabilization system protein ParE
MKNVVYHPRVPAEVRELLKYYDDINPELGDRFWQELYTAIDYAGQYPERHHFDLLGVGLRRSNLKDFPIHFLFRVFPAHIRVTVVRHDHRRPSFGIRRR